MEKNIINMVVLIISDRVSKELRVDETLPLIKEWLVDKAVNLVDCYYVPDEAVEIRNAIKESLNMKNLDLIVTSGGTGFSNRDITPEITTEFIEKFTPGINEYLRLKGTEITPFAALSRGVSGIVKNIFIVNLPGNPKGVIENLTWLFEILPHGLKLIKGEVDDSEHRKRRIT
jgi:molybdenum cofactor synthesis domain-containing protein